MNCALAGTRALAAVVKTGLEVEGCWAVGFGGQVLDMVSQLSRGFDFKGGAWEPVRGTRWSQHLSSDAI